MKFSSLHLLCSVLSLFSFPLATADVAQHPINYEGEHSNYGTDKEVFREKLKSQIAETVGETNVDPDDEQYYFFSLHDYNLDGKLDGHELRQAFAEYSSDDGGAALHLEEIVEMTDHVLEEDDTDGDGMISWDEYITSQAYHDDKL